MCDCVSLRRAADRLNVRPVLLIDLAHAGHLRLHRHRGRVTVPRSGVDDLRWRLAVAATNDGDQCA